MLVVPGCAHIHFLPIMLVAIIGVLCFCLIAFIVFRTISCWVWRAVRKNTVWFFLSASVSAGASDAAVFPSPVGAWASSGVFVVIAVWMSFSNAFWIGRSFSWGNSIKCCAVR